MTSIRKAEIEDIATIVNLAYSTWFVTYEPFVPKEQVDFMFGEIYTPDALLKQMEFLSHQFILIEEDGKALGYASYGKMIHETLPTNKLHKLYVLPETQGKGYGAMLLNKVEELSKEEQCVQVILNVNRENPAIRFYENQGYKIREEIDVPIGNYWMNDYIMYKEI